jgi:hypothetical protein
LSDFSPKEFKNAINLVEEFVRFYDSAGPESADSAGTVFTESRRQESLKLIDNCKELLWLKELKLNKGEAKGEILIDIFSEL